MIAFSPFMMCSIALLCFMPALQAGLAHARPLARPQRQALAGELATGLTGTGTSFSPLYEGQSLVDSYYGYQPEQRRTSPNDDILDNSMSRYGAGRAYQGGVKGGYSRGASGYGSGGYGGGGYGSGGYGGVSYGDGAGYGAGNDYNGWKGFGAGRNPAYGGRPTSQYGVKY